MTGAVLRLADLFDAYLLRLALLGVLTGVPSTVYAHAAAPDPFAWSAVGVVAGALTFVGGLWAVLETTV